MALPAREQALPLLAAANNHGDLAVKLSSLKQVKDVLLSVHPSHAAELFPYLVDLQSSPETLVRKCLIELIDEIGAKTIEHLSLLLPVLMTFLKDSNPAIAKQSIISGTKFFCIVLEELAFQLQRRGIVERWLEELWTWMLRFRSAVLDVIFEAGPVGPKLLGIKFLEMFILKFTLDSNDTGTYIREGMTRLEREFNVSWITDGHPVLDTQALISDSNKYLGILLDMLRSSSNFPGLLTISAVNSLAAIARKRPVHYKSVFSALLEFNPNFEMTKGRHAASIQYSLRTALLGFLRCTHPVIMESKDRLLKALRAMNAGDAADQVVRQVDKIIKNNERISRDLQSNKDDQLLNKSHVSGDVTKKRSLPLENEDQNNIYSVNSKRLRYGPHNNTAAAVDSSDSGQDHVNGILPNGDLTPVEQMIAMIGALIAEGERGVESLEILISNIHPDLLADIVITNMKYLPKNPSPLTRYNNVSLNHAPDSSSDPEQIHASNGSATPAQTAQIPSTTNLPVSDMSTSANFTTDSKRDPRRDPRRLDPRRVGLPPTSVVEDNASPVQSNFDAPSTLVLPPPPPVSISESISVPHMLKTETDSYSPEPLARSEAVQPILKNEVHDVGPNEPIPDMEMNNNGSDPPPSSIPKVEDIAVETAPMDVAMLDEAYSPMSQESDQFSPDISNVESSEIASTELPALPLYMDLAEDQQRSVRKQALRRIINSCQDMQRANFKHTQMALIARLFAQTDVDDVVGLVQRRILSDYEQQKGHELVMHILYHLHGLVISDSESSASAVYEKFLLGVAKSLLDDLPASDKSFSRLLGEVPNIPDSIFGLLYDVCTESYSGAEGHDGDRVTQGLGAAWSLIMGRPVNRQACLDIVLKCAIHSKDDVRAKAIRLVSNKLYMVSFISENIEQFATNMFLSAVEQRGSDAGLSESVVSEKRIEGQVDCQETSTSGSQVSEPGVSQSDSVRSGQAESQSDSFISLSQAQSLISLFFSLCTKKPSLLQLVFDTYPRAPKAVKQAVHRNIPVLIRTLESSYPELLHIISNPSQGSEHLLIQVLHVLCEGKTPPPDLVATVKRLYETRLKDATILIPVLSAFSRDEVLPIFAQLVNLPLDKFQKALAHILQGSAHTGPALTPVEVLVAIHDISPERDGIPLKKVTETCSACFEQRTVFTHQVLAKALDEMVGRTPLPLLFMRTVIQAIDAFPTLVDFVMEILSKLVRRQIWKLPKLWVGFLKCISQTQPHSFRVLLQLPAPQLEGALNRHANLRGPLTAFVNQSSARNSLPRSILVLLGLEVHLQEDPPHNVA